jgi:hypothetical protein
MEFSQEQRMQMVLARANLLVKARLILQERQNIICAARVSPLCFAHSRMIFSAEPDQFSGCVSAQLGCLLYLSILTLHLGLLTLYPDLEGSHCL